MPSHTVNVTATSTRRRREMGGRVARCGHPTKATPPLSDSTLPTCNSAPLGGVQPSDT